MTDSFDLYIREIVSRTLRSGGSASKPRTRSFLPALDIWSFPKYPSRTLILPGTENLAEELKLFIAQNGAALAEKDCWLGTWLNPQSGDIYLDIATGVETLEEAYQLAMKTGLEEGRHVVAMFNAKRNRTVYLREFFTKSGQG